jgi:hypothetical protein
LDDYRTGALVTPKTAPDALGSAGLVGAMAAVGELHDEFPRLLAAWLRHGEQILPDPSISLDGLQAHDGLARTARARPSGLDRPV